MLDVSYIIAYVYSKVILPPACVLTDNTEVAAGSACAAMQVSMFSIWLLVDKSNTFFFKPLNFVTCHTIYSYSPECLAL